MTDRDGCLLADPNLWLLLGIAASWVGVAQLARQAEKYNGTLQSTSIVHLMTWANATAWIVLAVPIMIRKSREPKNDSVGPVEYMTRLVSVDVFTCRHAFKFLAIALVTNYSYIGALHFLQASLSTAIFCLSPVFTLFFSVVCLEPGDVPRKFPECIFTWEVLSVTLSVIGVLCIAEPWKTSTAHLSLGSRLIGIGLSTFAAVGTATYQVYFKVTFGDRMKPDEVGLFLSYMGVLIFILVGAALLFAFSSGYYPLRLEFVPWGLVVSTSLSSALFNFLIKFGLSRDTPVAVSLATQIGIPLNLLVDVLVVHAHIDSCQMFGTILMLVAFSLLKGPACCSNDAKATTAGGSGGSAAALVSGDK